MEKETFNILGPETSMAAAMMHNGFPPNVRISQHMYDLIYSEPWHNLSDAEFPRCPPQTSIR
jgi:hypothetical protein